MPSHLGRGMHVPYLDRGPKAMTEYHSLTNLPFRPQSKLMHRYHCIDRPPTISIPSTPQQDHTKPQQRCSSASSRSSRISHDEPTDAATPLTIVGGGGYAKFIRGNERTIGPLTFLDSRRFTHTYTVKGKASARSRTPSATTYTFNFETGTSSPSSPVATLVTRPKTAVSLVTQTMADEMEFQGKMRVIEDHMWKHKQEERELKRVEGDVNKSKRDVQRVAREFESAMTRRMLEEEKKLNESIQRTEKVRVEALMAKEERTKQRISKAQTDLQQHKKIGREKFLEITHAQRMYKSKTTELEMRKNQINNMTSAYEEKLRRHESAAYDITQQLAALSIQINTEAVKGKSVDHEMRRQQRTQAQRYINDDVTHDVTLHRKLSKSNGINRKAENGRRQASGKLSGTMATHAERIREEDRRVTDNRHLMESNIASQKKLQDAAEAAELEKRKKGYIRNVEEHEHVKLSAGERAQLSRRKLAQSRGATWEKTFVANRNNLLRSRNSDLLKRFRRVVKTDTDMDQKLYQKSRQYDQECKSHEQNARKIEQQLVRTRAKAGRKTHDAVTEEDHKEKDLSKKLRFEKAEVAHVQNLRSTSDSLLHNYRTVAKESRYVYDELSREHKRLAEIGDKSDVPQLAQPVGIAVM